jgi:hypothetical protein
MESAAVAAVPLAPHTKEEKEQIRIILKDSVDKSVPYQHRSEYLQELMKREHYFSATPNDIGRTNLMEHDIELSDKDPVYTPQFRLPHEQLQFIRQNVVGWLKSGIVEMANSKYNSPIF